MIHPLLCLVLVLVPAAFNLTQSREGGARLDIIITAWDWDSVGGVDVVAGSSESQKSVLSQVNLFI